MELVYPPNFTVPNGQIVKYKNIPDWKVLVKLKYACKFTGKVIYTDINNNIYGKKPLEYEYKNGIYAGHTERVKEILLKNIGPLKKKKKKYSWWKPVVGYEKLYEVCKFGKVRCRGFLFHKKRNLKPYLSRGSVIVSLYERNGKRKAFLLKKLVYEHWVGPLNGKRVKLKDGNPFNCATSNMIKYRKKHEASIPEQIPDMGHRN